MKYVFTAVIMLIGGLLIEGMGISQGLAARTEVTKEVSVLVEQKWCASWGGNFDIYNPLHTGDSLFYFPDKEKIHMNCWKQVSQTDKDGTVLTGNKELFDYNFDLSNEIPQNPK